MAIKSSQRQTFFYILAAVVLVLSYLVLKPFIAVIVLAFLTALFTKRPYEFFNKIFKGRKKLASLIMVIIVFFVVLIPLVFVAGLTVKQVIQFNEDIGGGTKVNITSIVNSSNDILSSVRGIDYRLTEVGVEEWIQQGAKAIGTFFLERLPDISSGAFQLLTFVIVFLIVLYSLFPIQDKLTKFLKEISPLDDRIDSIYITRIIAMSKSMVRGTFLIAIVQAIISAIFLAIVGVDYILFLTILMIFLGVIPMVGTGFVMMPIGIIMLFTGNIWQGILLILVNVLIINNIDNFMRPKLVAKEAELHPALTILGVIGGLQYFGILGFVYGPVIMILLVTTIEIYIKHIRDHRTAV
ncbi:MAG: AI-2E family transporter [Patescibacteria group bacterium]